MATDASISAFVCRLGAERIGIDSAEITEVLEMPTTTLVPLAAPEVLGIANLRGTPLVICDLRKGMDVLHEAPPRFVLVTQLGDDTLGLAVDSIYDLVEFQLAESKTPPTPELAGTWDMGGKAGAAGRFVRVIRPSAWLAARRLHRET